MLYRLVVESRVVWARLTLPALQPGMMWACGWCQQWLGICGVNSTWQTWVMTNGVNYWLSPIHSVESTALKIGQVIFTLRMGQRRKGPVVEASCQFNRSESKPKRNSEILNEQCTIVRHKRKTWNEQYCCSVIGYCGEEQSNKPIFHSTRTPCLSPLCIVRLSFQVVLSHACENQ